MRPPAGPNGMLLEFQKISSQEATNREVLITTRTVERLLEHLENNRNWRLHGSSPLSACTLRAEELRLPVGEGPDHQKQLGQALARLRLNCALIGRNLLRDAGLQLAVAVTQIDLQAKYKLESE
jgi:hypothetical protein